MEEEEEEVESEMVEDARLEASVHVIHGKKPGDPKRRSLHYYSLVIAQIDKLYNSPFFEKWAAAVHDFVDNLLLAAHA
jgi:hypothetical protein